MSQPNLVQLFATNLEKELGVFGPFSDATKTWEKVRKHNPKCDMVTLRKKTSKSQDWLDAKVTKIYQSSKLNAYFLPHTGKSLHSEQNLSEALRSIRNHMQQTARHCANKYWV